MDRYGWLDFAFDVVTFGPRNFLRALTWLFRSLGALLRGMLDAW